MKTLICFALSLLLSCASLSYATSLQIGAPAGPLDKGSYADYIKSLTNPSEEDTAITRGNTLFAAGTFGPNVIALGGKGGSQDWSSFNLPTAFDGKGAILVASVANGSVGSMTVTVNGETKSSFYSSTTNSFFPNVHDPVKGDISDFLFFDIGNFSDKGAVRNFDDETTLGHTGSIIELLLAIDGYEWVHFDLLALETTLKDNEKKTAIKSTGKPDPEITTVVDSNAPSHDLTWKEPEQQPVPEPGTFMLLGAGFLGLAIYGKRRRRG